MSVACAVPEGASPPPEPPPRDYGDVVFGDDKIRARMEACKQGMMQLDALRSKHNRLMQEMRRCLPPIPGCVVVQARIKRSSEPQDRSSKESVDSAISTNTQSMSIPSRCSSPSISHRSSVSCDSGCSSVYSTDLGSAPQNMSYSTYRKLSVEERGLPVTRREPHQSPLEPNARTPLPIVATTIASTTSMAGVERHWRKKHGAPPRPRSMYERGSDKHDIGKDSMLDSASFSQITPPPIHRKLGIAQAPPTVIQATPRSPLTPIRFAVNNSPQSGHRRTPQKPTEMIVKAKAARVKSPDVVFHASRVFVERSPEADRRISVAPTVQARRPRSLFEPKTDEPLYATPARVLVRERVAPSFAQPTPGISRRTAFSPVVSRVVSSYAVPAEKTSRPRVVEREWRESEGL